MGPTEHICILGAKGMLGRELCGLLSSGTDPDALAVHFAEWQAGHPLRKTLRGSARLAGSPRITALDVEELDITRPVDVTRTLSSLQPTVVFNAAAYTDVDGCESRQDLAHAVNALAPGYLAEACRTCGSRLVQVSTDYVFDGKARGPHRPDDPLNPQSVYGMTKAEGEALVRGCLPGRHLIVRTSWLFGVHGRNFVKTILRLAGEREQLPVVIDQVGRPTCARDLAAALIVMGCGGVSGTHHFCNEGQCSWHGFAAEIVRLAGLHCRILPARTDEVPRPARRPSYSVLSTRSMTQSTGIVPRHWEQALNGCMAEMSEPPLLGAGDSLAGPPQLNAVRADSSAQEIR